jgi:hypothetical protein
MNPDLSNPLEFRKLPKAEQQKLLEWTENYTETM